MFHHQMKHLEIRQTYSAARHISNSPLGVVMKHCVSCLIYYIKLQTKLSPIIGISMGEEIFRAELKILYTTVYKQFIINHCLKTIPFGFFLPNKWFWASTEQTNRFFYTNNVFSRVSFLFVNTPEKSVK